MYFPPSVRAHLISCVAAALGGCGPDQGWQDDEARVEEDAHHAEARALDGAGQALEGAREERQRVLLEEGEGEADDGDAEALSTVDLAGVEAKVESRTEVWVRETLLPKVLGHTVILQDTIATLDGVTQRLGGAGTAAGGGMTAVYRQEWARGGGDAGGGGGGGGA